MLGVGRASAGRLQAKFRRTPQAGRGRPVRRMFQAEARLGRLVRLRRCWAPSPLRPGVENGHERESVYVYGAVSPRLGELDWLSCPEMNTGRMSGYLAPTHAAHPGEFIVMVADGASSHGAKELLVPGNIRLRRLPPCAPELNPQEHIRDELREKEPPTVSLPSWPASPDNFGALCPASRPPRNDFAAAPPGLGPSVSA